MSNDATAVVLTPAVFAATKAAKVKDPLPYLLICAFIAERGKLRPADLKYRDGPSLSAREALNPRGPASQAPLSLIKPKCIRMKENNSPRKLTDGGSRGFATQTIIPGEAHAATRETEE